MILNSLQISKPIISISACGINSQNAHFYVKSQNYCGLPFLWSDTKFMNACLFIIHLSKISASSKVFVEKCYLFVIFLKRKKIYMRDACLSMNSPRMNSVGAFNE